jgi:hemerythrin-like domain-containing protein
MIPNNSLPNLAQDLVRIHRAITRGLTVAVTEGTHFIRKGFPDPNIQQGFADYIPSLAAVLGAHHLSEDEILFPALKEKLSEAPYMRLSDDHQFIETSLDVVRKLIADLKSGSYKVGLGIVIEGFKRDTTIWTPHIRMEEGYFSQDAIASVMTQEEQAQISTSMAKHSREHAGPPYLALPFVLFNLSVEDRAAMVRTLPKEVMEEFIPKIWKENWAPMKPFLLE